MGPMETFLGKIRKKSKLMHPNVGDTCDYENYIEYERGLIVAQEYAQDPIDNCLMLVLFEQGHIRWLPKKWLIIHKKR
jgi:hypothetical protein